MITAETQRNVTSVKLNIKICDPFSQFNLSMWHSMWFVGLCGVYDGNKNNDMAMPVTGNQAGKVAHFIKGWR